MSTSAPVGVLGGTFDPVHEGHLCMAREAAAGLGLARVHLVPVGRPPHRGAPVASAEHRLAMLHRAVGDEPGLVVDDREVRRAGPSWTVTTLTELRAELGADVPLICLLGMDAFLGLPEWHEWRRLITLAHLVVLARPGYTLTPSAPLRAWLDQHKVSRAALLRETPAGCLWIRTQSRVPVSATAVRAALARGETPSLLPSPVLAYIRQHGLYGTGAVHPDSEGTPSR